MNNNARAGAVRAGVTNTSEKEALAHATENAMMQNASGECDDDERESGGVNNAYHY
jgi:hypothetical protein